MPLALHLCQHLYVSIVHHISTRSRKICYEIIVHGTQDLLKYMSALISCLVHQHKRFCSQIKAVVATTLLYPVTQYFTNIQTMPKHSKIIHISRIRL